MRSRRLFQIAACVATLCAALGTSVGAANWNRRTIVNFSGPVEIPGQVLPPGTYVFKLVDLPASRNLVQIQSEDQSFTFATLQTIDTWRRTPTNHTHFLFDESSGDQPEALRTWYYPGDTRGLDFIYSNYNVPPTYNETYSGGH